MGRSNILLIIGLIALVAFVVPDLLSMFVGQHRFYDEINCQSCHIAEYNEVNRSETGKAHIKAANNTNYTTYLAIGGINYTTSDGTIHSVENKTWTWDGTSWINDTTSILVSLDQNNNSEIDENEICHLCHNASLTGKHDAHAITMRTCDDDWCHGNRKYVYNDPELFNTSQIRINAGMVLNYTGNIHRAFYLSQCNESTGYTAGSPFDHTMGNVKGDYISKGYWTCISCHSEIQVDIEIVHGEFNHTGGQRRKYL